MSSTSALLPCLGMIALTAIVWLRLYVVRVGEMRAKRISPQALATSRMAAEQLRNTTAADNFRNLFEVPVLFYVFCLALAVTGGASAGLLISAWLYVALRAAHSYIHCTYNRVIHRFYVYAVSTLLLFVMWAVLAVRIARHTS